MSDEGTLHVPVLSRPLAARHARAAQAGDRPAARLVPVQQLEPGRGHRRGDPHVLRDRARRISLYVFGDEFTGSSIDSVVRAVDLINREDRTGQRRVRIHALGFPVRPGRAAVHQHPFRDADAGALRAQRRHVRRAERACQLPALRCICGAACLSLSACRDALRRRRAAARCSLALLRCRLRADEVRDPVRHPAAADREDSGRGRRAHAARVHRQGVRGKARGWRRRIQHRPRQGAVRGLHAADERDVHCAWCRSLHRAAAAATDPEIRGVLEPVLEDYAFVTPADSGTPTYAASLRYTIRLYSPAGRAGRKLDVHGVRLATGEPVPGQGRRGAGRGHAARDARRGRQARRRVPRAGDRARTAAGRATGKPQEVELPPPPPRN